MKYDCLLLPSGVPGLLAVKGREEGADEAAEYPSARAVLGSEEYRTTLPEKADFGRLVALKKPVLSW